MQKAKIDLNFLLNNIDGKKFEIENDITHAGKLLAQAMWAQNKTLKLARWAMELFKKKPIEIEKTDYDMLIPWIEGYGERETQAYIPHLHAGNIVQIVDSIREQWSKQNKS